MAIFRNRAEDSRELGFGSQNYNKSVRFISSDGTVNVERTGLGGINNLDIYHWLTRVSAKKLAVCIIIGYILINLIFGGIYFAVGPENYEGIDHSSKWQ